MTHKIAIVILNWNGRKLLEEYLPSVVKNIPDYAKIYIADNCSTDDSINYITSNFPEISIIKNDKNFGFAEGYNKALEKVNEKYYVLLNSDIECTPNWIEPVFDFMENNPEVGICQPKILDYNNKSKFEYAGAAGGFIDLLGYPFCRGRIFNELEQDENQYQKSIEIFWATGACLFIKRELFRTLEGFDESFFAHMEEIDLCWRAQRTGEKIYCIPESKVYHLGGGTLKKVNPKKTFLNFRNNLLMILKNDIAPKFVFRLFLKLLLDGIAGIKFLAEGSPLHTWSVVKAHFTVYGKIRSVLQERKKLKKKYPYLKINTISQNSIIVDHYLKGKKTFNSIKF